VYRNNLHKNYLFIFIGLDDKIKPGKPFLLYPQILEGLKEAGRLEFAEVLEDCRG